MICTEYFPAYTHSDDPDCKNCKYKGILRCTNPTVRVAMQRRKELKEKIIEHDDGKEEKEYK